MPAIKLAGKKNIRCMYTAGCNRSNLQYWNKYYDGILCYGEYHEKKFKENKKTDGTLVGPGSRIWGTSH